MLINRVGDIGLVLAMLLCLIEFGTLDFSAISGLLLTPNINRENVTIICLLLFWGAVMYVWTVVYCMSDALYVMWCVVLV